MSTNVLKTKEPNAIKSKLVRMVKIYSEVKKHNEKSGVERRDWEWYEKMDNIFGTRENITPSFIANKITDIEDEEPLNIEPRLPKNQKKIIETRERVWERKIDLEREKLEKNHVVEMGKLEIEKQKWEFEREKMKMEHELKMKEIEARQSNNSV
ncbi:hypothetical protein RhiirA4_475653 [Rhizophagus irregularis]|uniref:Uncharacterized protein n=1 Tax=Rhizophagus irregularis TaxID=588596 RepID=A0A2I1GY41_9GLOM|nr:hypothetical protein RhiirA4_468660 [Rhizophagus irregularis]PKY52764.1 hypothetical protein RhiirA4_470601 [Rhizophagus irregularis]PKY55861.1 hypothetical protein RhiirA4_475653 [Rhizophagus irregularis]